MSQFSLNNIVSTLVILTLLTFVYYMINIGNKYVNESNKIVLTRSNIVKSVFIIASVIILFFIFKNYPVIPSTIITVIASFVFAYIINPMVKYFEEKGLKRIFSIALVYVIILGIITLILVLLIPKTITETRKLISDLPDIVNVAEKYFDSLTDKIPFNNEMLNSIGDDFSKNVAKLITNIQVSFFSWISDFADNMQGYFSGILRVILVPVISFYILIDKEKILKYLKSKMPKSEKIDTITMVGDIDKALTDFVRGRLVMAIFVGFMTGIALLILKVDFAIVVGIVTAVADIVPYIGPFLGFLPAVLLAAIVNPMKALWVAIIFVIIQWVENNIIGPKILAESVGLHPLVVLLSLIVGGGVAGVWGMIFSVPIIATFKVIFKYSKAFIFEYIKSIIRPKNNGN